MHPGKPEKEEPEIKRESKEFHPEPEVESKRERAQKKDKIQETIDNIKQSETVSNVLEYTQKNTQHTIAYAILLIGIIWALFQDFFGGILVGLVAGFYFSKEIIHFLRSYSEKIEEFGTAKSLIFAGTLLALFIAAPGIFVGVLIMVAIKMIVRAD